MVRRVIPGYQGRYEVSDNGRVFAVAHDRRFLHKGRERRAHHKERELPQQTSKLGYQKVQLYIGYEMYTHLVHRLVAQAFIPNPDGLPEVNHLDSQRSNNKMENLEWCTRKQNADHSMEHGNGEWGEKRYNAALTNKRAKAIYQMHGQGFSRQFLALAAGVNPCVVHNICSGRSYRRAIAELQHD